MKKFILLLALLASHSQAATISCAGTVEKIGLHAPDRIMLQLSSMNNAVFICSPNSEWTVTDTNYKTSAETCKLMLSMLMDAKNSKTKIGPVWFDGSDVPTSCDSWESWKEANVRFFLY